MWRIFEPGVQLTRDLLHRSSAFATCVTEPRMLAAMTHVLGPGLMFSHANGRRTDPGHGGQPLHDLVKPRGGPFGRCNAIWCLDPFTTANGTRMLPGTHLNDREALSRMSDPYAPHPDEIRVVAPRGSVIIFNSHLIHAGARNEGAGPRRSVQAQFHAAGECPQCDWTTLPVERRAELPTDCLELLGLAPSAALNPGAA